MTMTDEQLFEREWARVWMQYNSLRRTQRHATVRVKDTRTTTSRDDDRLFTMIEYKELLKAATRNCSRQKNERGLGFILGMSRRYHACMKLNMRESTLTIKQFKYLTDLGNFS